MSCSQRQEALSQPQEAFRQPPGAASAARNLGVGVLRRRGGRNWGGKEGARVGRRVGEGDEGWMNRRVGEGGGIRGRGGRVLGGRGVG